MRWSNLQARLLSVINKCEGLQDAIDGNLTVIYSKYRVSVELICKGITNTPNVLIFSGSCEREVYEMVDRQIKRLEDDYSKS